MGIIDRLRIKIYSIWILTFLVLQAEPIASQSIESCPGYVVNSYESSGDIITANLELAGTACNVYGNDIKSLKLLVEYQSTKRLHVKIYDADQQVYQPSPESLSEPKKSVANGEHDLEFNIEQGNFSFSITRKSTNEVLFNTKGRNIIFESQYLYLRTSLPDNPNIYGLGENANAFRHDPLSYSQPLWAAGEPFMPQNTNLYGFYPVYYDHRVSGSDDGLNSSMHAVYLRNTNGMRVNLAKDGDGQYLEYNVIGGVIDLYFLSGPTPKEASAQLAEVVGYAAMMPYWSFGFHQCRFGYQDIYETSNVVTNYSAANIPLETIWNDLDYMDYRATFTLDPVRYPLDKTRAFIDYLHDNDQHYIQVLEPPIVVDRGEDSFQTGVDMDVFLKYPNGTTYVGLLWGGASAFPDWFAPNSQKHWDYLFNSFYNADAGVDIDGIWLDMNEASNFCDGYCSDPYQNAIQARDPPRPPPARMSSPFEIAGLPEDFQPHCFVTATFVVQSPTIGPGEDLLLVGNTLAMGYNNPTKAPQFTGLGGGKWTMTVQLPAKTKVAYKYVHYSQNGAYTPETSYRTINTGECGSTTTVTDDSPYPQTSSAVEFSGIHRLSNGVHGKAIDLQQGSIMSGLPDRELLNPPYDIKSFFGQLSGQALPTDLYHANGLAEYDVHNLYASFMARRSYTSLEGRRPGKRPFILSRSSTIGDGSRLAHWFGDNRSTDEDYRLSIRQMIQFPSMFQLPMVGSDVCGFNYDTNPTLCARWAVLGAWNPFYRNHAEISTIHQEFYRWELTADAARKAIDIRYRLLDYMYSALYRQTVEGLPMLTPTMWQYPDDGNTFDLDLQFFFGEAFFVAPVTEPESKSVTFYMPDDTFYDFSTLKKVEDSGAEITVENIDYDSIPVYVRGGNVVPLRLTSASTTTALRKQGFELIVAPDANGAATGLLYLDDGESIQPSATSLLYFSYADGTLSSNGTYSYDPSVSIQRLTVLDVEFSSCKGYNQTAKSLTFDVTLSLTRTFVVDILNTC